MQAMSAALILVIYIAVLNYFTIFKSGRKYKKFQSVIENIREKL